MNEAQIEAHIEIFQIKAPDTVIAVVDDIPSGPSPEDAGWWMTITGELFGPFPTDDAAIDTIPQALRSTF